MKTNRWFEYGHNFCEERYFAEAICRAQISDRNMINPQTEWNYRGIKIFS